MTSHRWKHWLAGIAFASSALLSGSAALALEVGDKAPNFALASSTGKEIKLADFAGRQHLVLFFYIGAFTNT
ncbi:MAG: redoxin domain-containing protein [Betaproteobacteria bacterium]|nr:redoxin domain-containing protein [Betaproteobacteria bacterium]